MDGLMDKLAYTIKWKNRLNELMEINNNIKKKLNKINIEEISKLNKYKFNYDSNNLKINCDLTTINFFDFINFYTIHVFTYIINIEQPKYTYQEILFITNNNIVYMEYTNNEVITKIKFIELCDEEIYKLRTFGFYNMISKLYSIECLSINYKYMIDFQKITKN